MNVSTFSNGYYHLPRVDVLEYSGDAVVSDDKLLSELMRVVETPLVKVSGGHYWLTSEWGVPSDTIAVPSEDWDGESEALLAKDKTTRSLVANDIVGAPE